MSLVKGKRSGGIFSHGGTGARRLEGGRRKTLRARAWARGAKGESVGSLEEGARGRARAKKGGSKLPHSKVLRTARSQGQQGTLGVLTRALRAPWSAVACCRLPDRVCGGSVETGRVPEATRGANFGRWGAAETAAFVLEINGERGGARTRDHRIKSPMLYRLSYPSTAETTVAAHAPLLLNSTVLAGGLSKRGAGAFTHGMRRTWGVPTRDCFTSFAMTRQYTSLRTK